MKTIFCVAAESADSGGVDWTEQEKAAQTDYTYKCASPEHSAETITLFSIQVPAGANVEEMTRLADQAMWDLSYKPITRRVGTDGILAQRVEDSCETA